MKNSVLLIIAVIVGIVIVVTVVEEVAIAGISRTIFVCVRPFSGHISVRISVSMSGSLLNCDFVDLNTPHFFDLDISPLFLC